MDNFKIIEIKKSVFEFDDGAVVNRIHKLNPNAEIFFISARTGEGIDA